MCSEGCSGHGTCVNDVCVCDPSWSGVGEGIHENDCHLYDGAIDKVWIVVGCGGLLLFLYCYLKLAYGVCRARDIDWKKLRTENNVFQLLLLAGLLGLLLAVYSLIRVLVRSYFLNDYLGSVVWAAALTVLLGKAGVLESIFHATLNGLLRAHGVQSVAGFRPRWLSMLIIAADCSILVPCIFSPAISPTLRIAMIRYFLVAFPFMALVHLINILIFAERAKKLLKAGATEATKGPYLKLRLSTLNFYVCAGPAVVATILLASTPLVIYFPYLCAVMSVAMSLTALGPCIYLVFDASKSKRQFRPAALEKMKTLRGDNTNPRKLTNMQELMDFPSSNSPFPSTAPGEFETGKLGQHPGSGLSRSGAGEGEGEGQKVGVEGGVSGSIEPNPGPPEAREATGRRADASPSPSADFSSMGPIAPVEISASVEPFMSDRAAN